MTPWTEACQASLSITNSWSLLRLMSIKSVMPSNHLILWHPLLLLPSVFPSITVFSTVSSSHQVAKVLEFQLQLQSFQWFPLGLTGFISLQSRYSQESSPIAQFESISSLVLSFLYSPTFTSIHDSGKTRVLIIWTFVGKVMSLLFIMLSKLVITFLPRSKHLLISWLQSLSAVILEPKKIKSITVCIFSSSICHEVMGSDAMIFVFWMLSFKPAFSLFFHFKRLFNSSSVSAIRNNLQL